MNSYDKVADVYDDLFSDNESIAENLFVVEHVPNKGRILDIGCGTGLLLDYSVIPPERYLGIDPSRCMLDIFRKKHPGYTVIQTTFEKYSGDKFDSIVSLFGAPSYIVPESFLRIAEFMNPGGRLFLMFYAPGYTPLTYKRTGVEFCHYSFDVNVFLGFDVIPYHNFLLVTNENILEQECVRRGA